VRPFRNLAVFLATSFLVPAAGQIVVTGGASRPNPTPLKVPHIVQLPTEDFVWYWGVRQPRDDPRSGDFSIYGTEGKFFCQLSGSFESIDPDTLKSLKNDLATVSPYFIQEATARMNRMFSIGSDDSWATLTCAVPDVLPTDEVTQERMQEAIERAERQRDQRRAREATDDRQ
jgi:hypothetical protein